MPKPSKFTQEQCQDLSEWFRRLRALGTVRSKARELGVSVPALYDAIARGSVPRESIHSENIHSESFQEEA